MANKTRKILLLPGDGIGPEVVSEVRKILEWMNKTKSLDFVLSQELIGGASIDANKVPITDEVFYKSLESDAVILGACLLYTSPSPRDATLSRMPSSA